MVYHGVRPAVFLERPNRFIARARLDGATVTAHVKNTGRCRELLIPGATVYLEPATQPRRKTQWSLVAVKKGDLLINMDSQAPNRAVEEALRSGWVPESLQGPVTELRREAVYGDSRLDFRFACGDGPVLMEVKGVTLEKEGVAMFPDAPTLRGIRHIRELISARKQGWEAVILFVVQMEGMKRVIPNNATHPEFGAALEEAAAAGVRVLAVECRVTPGSMTLGKPVPVHLSL